MPKTNVVRFKISSLNLLVRTIKKVIWGHYLLVYFSQRIQESTRVNYLSPITLNPNALDLAQPPELVAVQVTTWNPTPKMPPVGPMSVPSPVQVMTTSSEFATGTKLHVT